MAPLSGKEIHQPWVYFEKNKDEFPIKLGIDYPLPIVDHKQQRDKALLLYKSCK